MFIRWQIGKFTLTYCKTSLSSRTDLETQIYVIVKEPFQVQQETALQVFCISCGIEVFWLYVLLITLRISLLWLQFVGH